MTRRVVSLCLAFALFLASGLGAAACVCRLLSSAHQPPCCEDPCETGHAQRADEGKPGTDPEPATDPVPGRAPQRPPDCPGPLCFGCAPLPTMLDNGVTVTCPPHVVTASIVAVTMPVAEAPPGRPARAPAEGEARAGPPWSGFDVPLRI